MAKTGTRTTRNASKGGTRKDAHAAAALAASPAASEEGRADIYL